MSEVEIYLIIIVVFLNLIILVGEMCSLLLDRNRQSWHHSFLILGKICHFYL